MTQIGKLFFERSLAFAGMRQSLGGLLRALNENGRSLLADAIYVLRGANEEPPL
jgi:hypothetical protein